VETLAAPVEATGVELELPLTRRYQLPRLKLTEIRSSLRSPVAQLAAAPVRAGKEADFLKSTLANLSLTVPCKQMEDARSRIRMTAGVAVVVYP